MIRLNVCKTVPLSSWNIWHRVVCGEKPGLEALVIAAMLAPVILGCHLFFLLYYM